METYTDALGRSGLNPRSLIASACGVLIFFSAPLAANAQSRSDSVGVLVEAAHVAIDSMASTATVYLDPRPELREDSLAILTFDALEESGHEVYGQPGIPPRDVWLLSSGEIRAGDEGTEISAQFRAFGDKLGGLNAYSYVMTFRAECDERGCELGRWLHMGHGDGHMSADCWDDFFTRTKEARKRCRGL